MQARSAEDGGVARGSLAYLPVSLFGSAMALSGLALAWRLAAREFGAPAWIGEAIGVVAVADFLVLALAYGIKCAGAPTAVRAEFAHPVAANFFATPIIALLLLSAVVFPHAAAAGRALWAVGAVAMTVFAWWTVSRWMSVRQQLAHATPAWMVPVVGLLNVSIGGVATNPAELHPVCVFALAVGLFFTLPLFTLILSRLIFEEPMPPAQQPSLLILVATFAVGFSAYLDVAGRFDLYASALFFLAVFMFSVLVPRLVRLRSASPFHTSWWAVSFPLAAMSVASLKFSILQPSWPARAFAVAVLAFATLAVLSLAMRTVAGIARGELRHLTT